jgi:diacylglycerol kinase (ATP)
MLEHLRAAFASRGITDLVATQASGDEARLVHEAIADGIETIVVAGGDGTWGKCAVALGKAGSPARMAFVAAGTGNDFAKNLRAPAKNLEAMASLVASGGVERRVDLGRVDDAWFANVAGFGFDVAVLHASKRIPLLRGPAVYVAAALHELFGYAGLDAKLEGTGESPPQWQRRLMVVFANGKEFGGTFRIAPDARVDDGQLNALVFNDFAKVKRVPLLVAALRGTHVRNPLVRHVAAGEFTLECADAPWVELDGELHRTARARVTIASVPGALRVLDLAETHRG